MLHNLHIVLDSAISGWLQAVLLDLVAVHQGFVTLFGHILCKKAFCIHLCFLGIPMHFGSSPVHERPLIPGLYLGIVNDYKTINSISIACGV